MKKLGLVLAVFMLAISLIACSNGAKNSAKSNDHEGTASSNKYYENELNIATTAQPPTLDSATTVSQVALDIAGNIFETLYTLNADYQPTPMLAESYDKSKDGKTYTFHLRKGVKFHNGKEMTSDDVTASMNRWLQKSERAKLLLANAKFVSKDKYTVILNLEKPAADALILMSSQSNFPAIMPKEVIDAAGGKTIKEYVGTGPFKLKEWKQDQYIHLVKYDGYQTINLKASGFAGKKQAFVNDVYYRFVSDHSTRVAGIQTGEYDIADEIPIENYEQLKADQNVKVYPFIGGTLTMFYNTNHGVFSNVKVRQAVNTGLNMDEIMLASFSNKDLYSLSPEYMNPKQKQWKSEAGKDVYNQHNVQKAKSLLKEAGYKGEPVTLLTTKDYAEMYNATIVVQEQLKKLGINAKVENYDFPTFMEHKNDFSKWDIFITSNGYQLTPQQLLALSPDWAGYKDPKAAKMLTAIREAKTADEAKAKWDELQGYLYENLPSAVIGQYDSLLATTNKLEGFKVFEAPIIWNTKVLK